MISRFFCGEIDQRLSILEYDGTKCSGRYRAVIDGDQATVLQLQSVDTKDVPLSNLSLCPGLNETEVLEILSQDDTRSLACIMFLIERVEEDILYRSRDCQLLHDKKLSGELCESCQDLLDNLRLSVKSEERSQQLKFEHVNKVEEEEEEEIENDNDLDPDPDFVPPDEPDDHDDAEMREIKKPSVTVIRFRKKEPPKTGRKTRKKEPLPRGTYKMKKKDCDQCGQEFKSWKLLHRHQQEDHGDVTFVKRERKGREKTCPECQETFYASRKLIIHAKKVHNLDLPLPQDSNLVRCPFCAEVFHGGSSLMASHLKFFHPRESQQPEYREIMERLDAKTLICSDCGTGFLTSKSLEFHMVRVHGSHINTFHCEICGAFLKTQLGLETHLNTVHQDSEASHLCMECGKVFKYIALLKSHKARVHSNMVFNCTQCELTFNSQLTLKRHFTSKHTEKTIQCDQCDKAFHRLVDLSKHTNDVHNKFKPFLCEVCDFKCARLSNLHLHRRKSHNKAKYSKEMLINMVENGEHPKYTVADIPMLKTVRCN